MKQLLKVKIFLNQEFQKALKFLLKELQSLGLDVRLYSEDNKELELKENIEDGIEYDPEKDKKDILAEEEVVAEDDLADGYGEDVNDDILLDEEEIEDSDELFER